MNRVRELSSQVRRLFPGASADLLHLYGQAAEQAGLVHADFATIRDLLELSGYLDEEALHVLLLVLLVALDEGSVCVEASEEGLSRRLMDLIGEDTARDWAQRIIAALRDARFPELIATGVEEYKPVTWHARDGRHFLYFHKYLHHELALLAELRLRLESAALAPAADGLRAILRDVLVDSPLHSGGQLVRLNHEQRLALGLALLRNFVVISGGPGTGKTSVVFSLLRCLVRCGIAPERIALAAPTGRAAQRLADAVRAGLTGLEKQNPDTGPDAALKDLPAHTLHQLLGYHPGFGSFRHHSENPLPADVIIVDEVSMVGLLLMTRLLQAAAPGARLILLGDKDQLPSVDAGAVLAGLVPDDGPPPYSAELRAQLSGILTDLPALPAGGPGPGCDLVVVLQENFRSQKDIQEVARAIKRQETGVVDRLPRFALADQSPGTDTGAAATSFTDLEKHGGCWLLELADDNLSVWRQVLTRWAEHHFLSPLHGGEAYRDLASRCQVPPGEEVPAERGDLLDRLLAVLDRSRVLTLLREGPWGCVAINRFMAQLVRSRSGGRDFSDDLFPGAPVLITRNDHGRQLFNGDVGIVLRSANGHRVVFPRQGGYVSWPVEGLPAHELAFSLTVHKGQGGEYGQVLLVVPPEGGRRLLTRELVYTGITRARQLAVICGTPSVLAAAIARRVTRESSFRIPT